MSKKLRICLGILVILVDILVWALLDEVASRRETPSLEDIFRSQCEEVKVELGKRQEYVLCKTNPALVECWYQYHTFIDDQKHFVDLEEGKSYVCLDFAFDSAEEWRKRFSNQALYIAGSQGAYHKFNAIYLGGDPLNIESWSFIEPQWGRTIKVGNDVWSFPVEVELEHRGFFKGEEFVGLNTELELVWQSTSTTGTLGTLFRVDQANNLIPD